jgi:hypothetical protein
MRGAKYGLTEPELSSFSNEDLMIELIDRSMSYSPITSTRMLEMSEEAARREYGTVKMSFPRQFGHTTTAIMLLEKYNKNSVMFVRDGRNYKCFESRVKDHVMKSQPLTINHDGDWDYKRDVEHIMSRVFTATDARLERKIPKYVDQKVQDVVILDQASEFTSLEKAGIVSLFKHAKLIIQLQ